MRRSFASSARRLSAIFRRNDTETGYALYCTDQCPFNAKYVPIAEQAARDRGIPFRAIRPDSLEAAYEIASAATSREEIGNPVYPPASRRGHPDPVPVLDDGHAPEEGLPDGKKPRKADKP